MAKRPKKNKEAGEAFKELLKQKEFTQYKLEQVTGIDKSVISKIANGYTAEPKLETLQKIADALGVELFQLTEIFHPSSTESSHSDTNPQPQKSSAEREIASDSDFLGREDAIANSSSDNVDKLVQETRQKVNSIIQEICNTMQVIDMSHPIRLYDIYTYVNVLDKITGRRRLDMAKLMQNFDPNSRDFNIFGLGKVPENRIPGLTAVDRYCKLMVLGKPGSGKTTFLKYIAIKCIYNEFQSNKVPIFITLKEFAENNLQLGLIEFINHLFVDFNLKIDCIIELFKQGKILLLLDGLDEVREEHISRVIRQIKDIFRQYNTNNFVVTCRIAASEYTFNNFTEVEITDFDEDQIEIFVDNWFSCKKSDIAENFMEEIAKNNAIKELATSPLLLTLLCIEFEDAGNFSVDHAELYNRVTRTILKKWDAKREIERNQVYKKLNIQLKEELLSQIALITFERQEYFFKQRDIEQYIADYIRSLPTAPIDPEAFQIDCEQVLKSIEAQHGLLVERARGIYSFSHLTFQEYFTARKIVNSCDSYSLDNKILQNLAKHITDYHWREVILLTVLLLPSADSFLVLMKKQVDLLTHSDKLLQQFLTWLNVKSESAYLPDDKQAVIRAFYFEIACRPHMFLILEDLVPSNFTESLKEYCDFLFPNIDIEFNFLRHPETALDTRIIKIIDQLSHGIIDKVDLDQAIEFSRGINYINELNELLKYIRNIKNSTESEYSENIKEQSYIWLDTLNSMMTKFRNISYDWQFTQEQWELLKAYHDANLLLLECLNSDCKVSPEVRSHIEDTLLLPIAEIEKRQIERINAIAF